MNNANVHKARLGMNLTTVVAAASLAVHGGPLPSTSVTYAMERRMRVSGLELDGKILPGPEPLRDVAPAPIPTSAHNVTWRSVPTKAAIDQLKRDGLFWAEGGPTHPTAPTRKRIHLKVPAATEEQALSIASASIEAGGGDASDLTIVHGDPARRRDMLRAIRRVNREARRH